MTTDKPSPLESAPAAMDEDQAQAVVTKIVRDANRSCLTHSIELCEQLALMGATASECVDSLRQMLRAFDAKFPGESGVSQ